MYMCIMRTLDKDPNTPLMANNIIGLPRSVKKVWSPVETLRWEFLVYK